MIHRVQPGDRFSSIAAAYGVAPRALLEANAHKPRARTLGGAEVFATLSFGEPVRIPQNAHKPPHCIKPNTHINRDGECVCDPGHILAPTGHCMEPVRFLPPGHPHTFVSLGVPGGLPPHASSISTADAMDAITVPACPQGSQVDPTGEFCMQLDNLPPLVSAGPCPPGTAPDTWSGKYCIAPTTQLDIAASHCPMVTQPDGSAIGGFYDVAAKLCLPPGFTGGDTVPEGARCPDAYPYYDAPSGKCMEPHPAVPGLSNATSPTCTDPAKTWTGKACVVLTMDYCGPCGCGDKNVAQPCPPTDAELARRNTWWILGVTAVLLGGGGVYFATRKKGTS